MYNTDSLPRQVRPQGRSANLFHAVVVSVGSGRSGQELIQLRYQVSQHILDVEEHILPNKLPESRLFQFDEVRSRRQIRQRAFTHAIVTIS